MADSAGAILHALCAKSFRVMTILRDKYRTWRGTDGTISSKKRRGENKGKKPGEEGEKETVSRGGRRGRDGGAGALFLWEDPMHNLDSRAQV